MFPILLAAQLLIMSDRDHFVNADNIAENTVYAWDQNASGPPIQMNSLKGKRALILIHGFNNPAPYALKTFRIINEHLSSIMDENGQSFYDIVIGYLWPGCDGDFEYYKAKGNADKLASRMRSHIAQFSAYAASVDIMAHSMGNFLAFNALNFAMLENAPKVVRNFYSLAPAVDNETVEKGGVFSHSIANCENVYVFHSDNDDVLKFLFTFSEFDLALGYDGVENLKKKPDNLSLVDCTAFVSGHSAYFAALPLYDYIKKQLIAQNMSNIAKKVESTKQVDIK